MNYLQGRDRRHVKNSGEGDGGRGGGPSERTPGSVKRPGGTEAGSQWKPSWVLQGALTLCCTQGFKQEGGGIMLVF